MLVVAPDERGVVAVVISGDHPLVGGRRLRSVGHRSSRILIGSWPRDGSRWTGVSARPGIKIAVSAVPTVGVDISIPPSWSWTAGSGGGAGWTTPGAPDSQGTGQAGASRAAGACGAPGLQDTRGLNGANRPAGLYLKSHTCSA